MVLEIHIEQKACAWLTAQGCDCLKIGLDGWPDRQIIYLPDRHFWIEFKRPGGDLTKAQKVRIPLMRKRGHTVFVCESVVEAMQAWRVMRARP